MQSVYKESLIAKRSFQFSLIVIQITKSLDKSYEIIIIIKQLIRSVTSIGANIEEALGANSKKEFTHCMNIAKKEARETLYWLRLLHELVNKKNQQIRDAMEENQQIINILTKIVKTSGSNVV